MKPRKKDQTEESAPTRPYGLEYGTFSIVAFVSVLAGFTASWVVAYLKAGWTGILFNGGLMSIIGILGARYYGSLMEAIDIKTDKS